ncbi:tannase/feruloyl esterase family alpha/beta hydrolase, partial [Acinetobacter baumannii]|uniref:tannase/feruloyl esterase family alpha/beta hydrolase n=1 Tax=Acinetobacter baumannii TaxID=470 RepID=UPI001F2FC2EF
MSCAALTEFEIANTEITSAEMKSAGSFSFGANSDSTTVALPDHCYVEGISNEREGADGKTYGLGFALAMPANWSGRFLFQGGGGLNGTVHPPLGGNAAGDTPALARGFAVISTDGGHKGKGGFDASFMADQQAALDFTGQSVAKVTQLGKDIAKAY